LLPCACMRNSEFHPQQAVSCRGARWFAANRNA
jgi:hypothetical protein